MWEKAAWQRKKQFSKVLFFFSTMFAQQDQNS